MLQFSRGKTKEKYTWAVLLLGHVVGHVAANYRSKTKRSWSGEVSIPLRDGTTATAKVENIFSAKQLFGKLNEQLTNVRLNDVDTEALTAQGKSIVPSVKATPAPAPAVEAPAAAAPAAASDVNTTHRWKVSNGTDNRFETSRAAARALAATLGKGYVAKHNPDYVGA